MSGVLVVEGNPDGHRLMYAGRLIAEARAAGLPVELLTSEAAVASPQYAEFVTEPPDQVHLGGLDRLRAGRTTVLLDGDRWLPRLVTWPSRHRLVALLLRPVDCHPLKPWLIAALRRKIEFRSLTDPFGTGATTFPAVRDPLPRVTVTPRGEARAALGVPSGATVVMIAGVIDARKSVVQVLDWVAASGLTLVLAGRCADDVRPLVPPSVIAPDRFLGDAELATCYSAADAVLVLHENEGSSGALAHAAAHGVPVVAWGSTTVTRSVQAHGLGAVATGRTPAELDDALARALAVGVRPRVSSASFLEQLL